MMTDYPQLEKFCRRQSVLSRDAIDSFLLYYSAEKDKTDKAFDLQIVRYKNATKKLPASWGRMAKSQFIAHRIFSKNGLIHGYLKHAAVKNLPDEQFQFLREQSEDPWLFRFCSILSRPAPDFFLMEDVFREEKFLLFSPALTQTLAEQPVLLCFLLTGYNGECWQTFGPFVALSGFDEDDIFFYATEIKPEIFGEEELVQEIEENPVPFMLLISGSNLPRMVKDNFELVHVGAETELLSFDLAKAKKHFTVLYAPPVFKLSNSKYDLFPHYAVAYYHEEKAVLSISAMTDYGYTQLHNLLHKAGINIVEEPEFRVHLPMVTFIKDTLGKTIAINPYEKLFEIKESLSEDKALEKLNRFLRLALNIINAGEAPDIDVLAKEAGVDPDNARQILAIAMEQAKKMKK
jgi:hypothetical protein